MFLEVLTQLMQNKGLNKSDLAKESGIPYTTIDGFYKKGCDNVKLSTLQKLSKYFNVSLDYLINGDEIELTEREKAVIRAYRNFPEMQAAVDRLLGIKEIEPGIQVYRAARSDNNHEDEIITISAERLQRLKDAPETDEDL